MGNSRADPAMSIVAPAHNEQDNVELLIREISTALDAQSIAYDIIVVDDASTDATFERLQALMTQHPRLRVIHLSSGSSGRNGQSAAFQVAFNASRGGIIAMLDADLQNDPAEIPRLFEMMQATGADLIQGDRSRSRCNTPVRRASSLVGRLFRRWLLGDTVRDTGCSLRLLRREVALALPLQFTGMHRFIPITARQLGYTVIETPVSDRPRRSGESKYGVWNRAIPGLIDCFAVRWMHRRRHHAIAEESPRSQEVGPPRLRSAAGRAQETPSNEANR